MGKYELTEGEARLLVAVFEHLKPYYEQAKANKASVVTEMNYADEGIFDVYYGLLEKALIGRLSEREYKVIAQRYELSPYKKCSTREEIARNFNVTRERIRQIEARAIQKIRRFMTELDNAEARMATEALKDYKNGQYAQWMLIQDSGDREAIHAYVHNYNACINAINKIEIQKQIRKWRDEQEMNAQRQK